MVTSPASADVMVEVPTLTLPLPNMLKSEAFVDDATVNNCVLGPDAVEVVETDSWAIGVVVPIPIAEVVADCPTAACVQASYDSNPLPVIVIGVPPMVTNDVQDAVPEQDTAS